MKDKADSRSSSVWDDAGVALALVQVTFTTEEMKVFSSTSPNKVVGRYLHKLIQVVYLCKFIFFFFFFLIVLRSSSFFQVLGESLRITSEYLSQEAKVVSAVSKVETLKAENSKLEKDLIIAMDEANTLKEKIKVMGDDLRVERQLTVEKDEQLQAAKEKIKTIAAMVVKAFRQTNEYNTVLFSWYFKGFELLRRYLVKHPSRVNMESLDLEKVDKEMALDEAAQSSAPGDEAPEPAADVPASEDTVDA